MLARIASWARHHPSIFSGAWFAGSALLLLSPLGVMVLLYFALEILAGRSGSAYLALTVAAAALPLLSAFGMGALIGPRILRLPPDSRSRAAAWGAVTALAALLLWVLFLEAMPGPSLGGQTTGGGGDVPEAAVVVGYLVVLPLIFGSSLLAGAAAGVLLHIFAMRGRTAGDSGFLKQRERMRSG